MKASSGMTNAAVTDDSLSRTELSGNVSGRITNLFRGRKKYFAHTLNNTVVAPPRMLIAFLENNLNEDGTVNIPVALRPYMGGKEIIG